MTRAEFLGRKGLASVTAGRSLLAGVDYWYRIVAGEFWAVFGFRRLELLALCTLAVSVMQTVSDSVLTDVRQRICTNREWVRTVVFPECTQRTE